MKPIAEPKPGTWAGQAIYELVMAHLLPDFHDAGEYQLARLLSDPNADSRAEAITKLDALIEASRVGG